MGYEFSQLAHDTCPGNPILKVRNPATIRCGGLLKLMPEPLLYKPLVKSVFYWRPRRDLNPCYRRERAWGDSNLLKIQAADGSLNAFTTPLVPFIGRQLDADFRCTKSYIYSSVGVPFIPFDQSTKLLAEYQHYGCSETRLLQKVELSACVLQCR